MEKFFIEVPHQAEPGACMRAVKTFLNTGSHFLTNAEWGCRAGVHTAWIIVEAENDAEARLMVPPVIRRSARLVKLNRFTTEEIREMGKELE